MLKAGKAKRLVLLTAVVAFGLGTVVIATGCGDESSSGNSSPSSEATSSSVVSTEFGEIAQDSALNAMVPEEIRNSGVLRVGSAVPYPPWEMFVSEGSSEVTGFDYDMATALSAKLGLNLSFQQVVFASAIPALKAGKVDVFMACMADTAERREVLDFVDYALDGTQMMVAKGNPEGITTLDDLAGKTVAVQSGTTQEIFLQKTQKQFKANGKPAMDILVYPQDAQGQLAVSSGKAVADLTDGPGGIYIAKETGKYEMITDPEAPQGYLPALIGAGIVKGNDSLRDATQKALQALIDDGTYQKILAKWGFENLGVESATVNQGE